VEVTAADFVINKICEMVRSRGKKREVMWNAVNLCGGLKAAREVNGSECL